jgi:hypothetical protein
MEIYLMVKKLKTHAASFKFKVVLESFTTNTVAAISWNKGQAFFRPT